jgi:hypothetical protein
MSPFGGWYDSYYTEIFCPAVEAAGLHPHRADDLYRPSAIVQDIWTAVKSSRVMLADLTDKNPNVFYELGLAHAVDKPVVLISQSMEDVPFDLRALRVITYEIANPDWAGLLRSAITAALQEVLAAPATAVLQPFQKSGATTPRITVEDEQNPAIQALMRELNSLRAEIRARPSSGIISSSEARLLVRRYLRAGIPPEEIVDRVARRGAPTAWVRRQIESYSQSPIETSTEGEDHP